MIIDCHVHIDSADDTQLSKLLAAADRAGVEKLCISSLGRRGYAQCPDPNTLEEAASDVLAACEKHPDRFVGATYVTADHVAESLDLLERCNTAGLCRFIKLWVSQFCDDPRLDPIFERAIELKVAVLAHTWIKATGNLPHESTCHHAVRMAARHPELRCWIAHYSGRWEETGRIVAPYPNLCVDVSGGEVEDGILDCLLRHVPAERIFYGSDAPGRSFIVQMAKVNSATIAEQQRRLILGENIARWIDD